MEISIDPVSIPIQSKESFLSSAGMILYRFISGLKADSSNLAVYPFANVISECVSVLKRCLLMWLPMEEATHRPLPFLDTTLDLFAGCAGCGCERCGRGGCGGETPGGSGCGTGGLRCGCGCWADDCG